MRRPGVHRNEKRLSPRSGPVFLTLAGVTLALFVACEGGGMSGENAFVGTQDTPDRGVRCYQCIEDIIPDPVDCLAAEKDIEFLPVTIWNFESEASNMYLYYDRGAAEHNLVDNGEPATWKPETESADRCIGQTDNEALHFKAGPFTNWGGGLGRHLKCLNNADSDAPPNTGRVKIFPPEEPVEDPDEEPVELKPIERACEGSDPMQACSTVRENPEDEPQDEASRLARTACPQRDIDFIRSGGDYSKLENPDEEFLLGATLDLSEWDGVSFWGRRSNDSDAGVRFALGDRTTSDDINFLQYHINPGTKRACERNVECGCPGDSPCTFDAERDPLEWRCYDAAPQNNGPGELDQDPAEIDVEKFQICGQTMCTDDFAAFGITDMQTYGTTCQAFTSRGGYEDKYCFHKEEGPFPVDGPDKCGDHWVQPVRLSNQWQFYKIPFTSLLQEGWAKESFKLDLTSLAVLRFTFGTGYSDIWIDDVRVYRDLKNSTDD